MSEPAIPIDDEQLNEHCPLRQILPYEWQRGKRHVVFPILSDYVDQNGNDLDGREQAHAPSYQFFAGLQWDVSERWSARVEVEGKDEYYFSASHAERSEAFELVNASLTYSAAAWQARLWARNLGDEDYFVRGFFFGNDPRDGYTDRVFTQLGEPRQVGVTLTMNW